MWPYQPATAAIRFILESLYFRIRFDLLLLNFKFLNNFQRKMPQVFSRDSNIYDTPMVRVSFYKCRSSYWLKLLPPLCNIVSPLYGMKFMSLILQLGFLQNFRLHPCLQNPLKSSILLFEGGGILLNSWCDNIVSSLNQWSWWCDISRGCESVPTKFQDLPKCWSTQLKLVLSQWS